MGSTIADQQTRLSRRGLAAVRALRDLGIERDEIAAKIKKYEDVLKGELAVHVELGGKAVGTDAKGYPLVSLKSSIIRTINAAMLRKENPELAEQCTTESERRRLYLAPVPE